MISDDNKIESFLHCGLCINELKAMGGEQSPRDYANVSVGWNKEGLQVWCNRHDCNILHVDFEGVQHPASTTRKPTKNEVELK